MDMRIPLLDLRTQFEEIRGEVFAAIERVVELQRFVLGPEVEGLEREIADYCTASHGVGCSSGSDALLLALTALGVGPGDEVITTPYTFFATAGSIVHTGARPVFVDIEPQSYNIDPAGIQQRITARTRAILPVHLYGQVADMDPILQIAAKHGLPVVEDACQAIGAEINGRRAGSLGQLAALSFFPSKNLGGFGDGGMVTTNDPHLAEQMRIIRVHGMQPKYHHPCVGFNARLDALQAAVLRVKLRRLDQWTSARHANAQRYNELVSANQLDQFISVPRIEPGRRHVFNQYVVRVPAEHRDPLRDHLLGRGITTEIYYPVPLHLQPCFAKLGYQPGQFLHAEQAASQTIALPIYPELTEEQQTLVIESIRAYVDSSSVSRQPSAA